MKLIDLLNAAYDPNPSGYFTVAFSDDKYLESTAATLLTSLSSNVLEGKVTRITMTTKLNTFPVLKAYVDKFYIDKED